MRIGECTGVAFAARSDRRVAAVILTATGDRTFCTGGDVQERAETGGSCPAT